MRGFRHPYAWGRNHPLAFDGFIAVACIAVGFLSLFAEPQGPDVKDPDAISAVLTVVPALALVWRRRHPLAVYCVIGFFGLVFFGADYEGAGPWFAILVGLYGVAAYVRRRTALWCLATTVAVLCIGLVVENNNRLGNVLVGVASFATAWVLGDNMRVRLAYTAAVEDRAAHLEAEQEALAQRAVLEERSRIARDLHDIVAHSMSVMVVQAGAARRTVARDPERAVEAIGHIESTGRGALAEMRRLVGVLRDSASSAGGRDHGGTAPRLPQPGIDQLEGLVQQCRDAGLDVTLRFDGNQRPLPSGVELVVYRIVQEALTNTMQHAGPARAEVDLRYGDDAVSVTVADDGRGAAPDAVCADEAAGHGLVGMQERVALYDGSLLAGPRPGGGFRVCAEIPLVEAAVGVGGPAVSGGRAAAAGTSGVTAEREVAAERDVAAVAGEVSAEGGAVGRVGR